VQFPLPVAVVPPLDISDLATHKRTWATAPGLVEGLLELIRQFYLQEISIVNRSALICIENAGKF
jgi:hypothetical protein